MKRAAFAFAFAVSMLMATAASAVWEPMGQGFSDEATALTIYNGDLIAGGRGFEKVARWNDGAWEQLPPPPGSWWILALTEWNGDLIAGGYIGGYISRWDGSSWNPLGSGMNEKVRALCVYEGDLVAAGDFTVAGGVPANGIARWDGTSWKPFGEGTGTWVSDLAVFYGHLYAAGWFEGYLKEWTGSEWRTIEGLNYFGAYDITVHNQGLITGGYFGEPGNHIARWDGVIWLTLGGGTDAAVYCSAVYLNQLVCGGYFYNAGGVTAHSIARWDGFNWSALEIGMDGSVMQVMEYNGDLIAVGNFDIAGHRTCHNVARWRDPTSEVRNEADAPDRLTAAPNPFRSRTILSYFVPAPGRVQVSIFDVQGRRLADLTDGTMSVGDHSLTWDARDRIGRSVAPGVYLARITTGQGTKTERLVLTR